MTAERKQDFLDISIARLALIGQDDMNNGDEQQLSLKIGKKSEIEITNCVIRRLVKISSTYSSLHIQLYARYKFGLITKRQAEWNVIMKFFDNQTPMNPMPRKKRALLDKVMATMIKRLSNICQNCSILSDCEETTCKRCQASEALEKIMYKTSTIAADGMNGVEVKCSPSTALNAPEKCLICSERMTASSQVIKLNICKHTFHYKCVSKLKDAKCPNCNVQLDIQQLVFYLHHLGSQKWGCIP